MCKQTEQEKIWEGLSEADRERCLLMESLLRNKQIMEEKTHG